MRLLRLPKLHVTLIIVGLVVLVVALEEAIAEASPEADFLEEVEASLAAVLPVEDTREVAIVFKIQSRVLIESRENNEI